MDEARKEWCKKYKVDIVPGGFIDSYCLPEHVMCVLSPNGTTHFIGFDGVRKTYDQLTEEEKQDYESSTQDTSKLLTEFLDKRKREER